MRQLLKNTFTLALALVFTAGLAFGQSNTSSVDQDGDDNQATVQQNGSDNMSTVKQGFDGQGQNNAEAMIQQTGSENMATIKQRAWAGRDNDHTVEQNGSSNSAQVDAFNGGNTGSIEQIGNTNEALMQHGAAKFGEATIQQYGDENYARARQFQGENNSATIKQGNSAYESNGNYGDIRQEGSGNTASFSLKRGDDNDVSVSQDGDQNYSEYSVASGDANKIDVSVGGSANRTRFSIDSDWPSFSSSNTLYVDKDGDTNYFTGSIKGSGNTVDVTQHGDDNRIGTSWYTKDGVSIAGDGNTATVSQMSDMNSASVTMSGSGNTATVTQN